METIVNAVETNNSYATRAFLGNLVALTSNFLRATVVRISFVWSNSATVAVNNMNIQSIYIPLMEP